MLYLGSGQDLVGQDHSPFGKAAFPIAAVKGTDLNCVPLSRATAGIPLFAGGHILSSVYRISREKLCAAVGD